MVEPVVFVKQFQRRLKALRETVNRCVIKALVIDAANFENHTDLPALGEKDVRADEAIEIDLLAEGAGLVVVLEDAAKSEHGHLFGLQWG